ncbi:SPW repeat protein [Streptosporangium pseudovulgare]|nr:SPW repeat protein [Streptosporangium pseudovulgare]
MRARYDRATQTPVAQVVGGLTFLAGLYLAISPWVVGFSGRTTITVNNLVTGLAVAALAVGFASAYGRTRGVAWVTPIIGLWTIIAPWVVSPHSEPASVIVSNVIVGVVLLLCGLAEIAIGMRSSRRKT